MGKREAAQEDGNEGRPRKLSDEQIAFLVDLVREDPLMSLDDVVAEVRRRHGIRISAPTARKYLQEAGFERSRPQPSRRQSEAPRRETNEEEAKTYRYAEHHRDPGDAARYPCGLTDSEWEHVRHLFDPPGKPGRPPKYPRRQVLDACIYVLRSGCSWRMLPRDFPPWHVVYRTFRRWLSQGLFEQMYDELRKLWRSRQRRNPDPSTAVLDSQSVKTSAQGGPKGYDSGKKVKGRKRHIVTDSLGLLVAVLVTAANTQDRDAALPAVDQAMDKVPGIERLYVDGGYAGQRVREIRGRYDVQVNVVRHPGNRNVGRWHHRDQLPLFEEPTTGFVPLPKRWVVERTNAWNDRPRRMGKDHDRRIEVSTAWIWLADGRRLLRRLTSEEPESGA